MAATPAWHASPNAVPAVCLTCVLRANSFPTAECQPFERSFSRSFFKSKETVSRLTFWHGFFFLEAKSALRTSESHLWQGNSIIQGLVYINQGLNYINQTLNYINQTLVYRLRVTWRSLQASEITFAPLYLTFQQLSRCSESFDTFLLRSRVLHLMGWVYKMFAPAVYPHIFKVNISLFKKK